MTVAEAPEFTEEQDEILAAMEGMRHAAPEPTGLAPGEVINKAGGNEELPVNMIASSVTSAGYTYVWNRQTGERSAVNNNMLPAQLKKRNTDGTMAFTVRKPNFEPKRGTLKCMLHKDDPQRSMYDTWGLPVCKKDNLTSPYMVSQHMAHRHRNEWATIQREQAEQEKRDERRRTERHQKELVAAMLGRMAAQDAPVDDGDGLVDMPPVHRAKGRPRVQAPAGA